MAAANRSGYTFESEVGKSLSWLGAHVSRQVSAFTAGKGRFLPRVNQPYDFLATMGGVTCGLECKATAQTARPAVSLTAGQRAALAALEAAGGRGWLLVCDRRSMPHRVWALRVATVRALPLRIGLSEAEALGVPIVRARRSEIKPLGTHLEARAWDLRPLFEPEARDGPKGALEGSNW